MAGLIDGFAWFRDLAGELAWLIQAAPSVRTGRFDAAPEPRDLPGGQPVVD